MIIICVELKKVVEYLCSKNTGLSKMIVNEQQYQMMGMISQILEETQKEEDNY